MQRIKIKMQPPWWRNYIEDNILNSRYYEKGKKIVLFNEKGFWQKCQKGLRTGLRQVSVTRLSVAAGISTRTLTAPGKALTYE